MIVFWSLFVLLFAAITNASLHAFARRPWLSAMWTTVAAFDFAALAIVGGWL